MRLQKLMVLVTFVLGILFIVAFAFNLIPEDTLNKLQSQLNFNLEDYLAKLTAYSGAGFAVSLAGTMSKAASDRSDKLYGVRITQQNELFENAKTDFSEGLQLKQQEIDIEREKNRLAEEKNRLDAEKNKILNDRLNIIANKSYRKRGK